MCVSQGLISNGFSLIAWQTESVSSMPSLENVIMCLTALSRRAYITIIIDIPGYNTVLYYRKVPSLGLHVQNMQMTYSLESHFTLVVDKQAYYNYTVDLVNFTVTLISLF